MTLEIPAHALAPVINQILTRLQTVQRTAGVAWHQDAVFGGEDTVTDGQGRLMPYGIFTSGNRGYAPAWMQGITGTRDNLRQWYFGIEAYGKDAAEVQRITDDVVDVLEGFIPDNCGEISLDLEGKVESPVDFTQNQARDGRGLIFVCLFGTRTE